MNSIKTVIKYELIRYFTSPLAYVYLISFLLLSGSCAIYFGHFFVNDAANLWGLFDYQPWIYLLFIPGIAMRSWAEEFRSKSVILLLTTPVSLPCLVCGKFLASWLFAIIAIMLTFPFWITVNLFGTPDNTVIFVSYLSCFVLAGAMLAISQTMSPLTKNAVISLVLSVFVNLLFFWSGVEYVLFWARELFSDVIVDTIVSFSFLTHFDTLSRGLIELRDIVFFGSLIAFFNLTTIAVISLKTKGSSGLVANSDAKQSGIVFILFFICFFGLNIIANNILRQVSYDFTEEKYLSLTKNTKDVLRKLDRPIIARLYYSPILGKRNPELMVLFDQIKLMLKQYRTYSNGKFDYRIYTPQFLDKIEDRAIADGLQPIPLVDINQNALFGITFTDNLMNKSIIPFFSLERLGFLEQDFTTSIYKLQHKKKKLGLFSTLPVMGNVRQDNVMINRWEIMNKIGEIYDIKEVKKADDFDEDFDVFMLIHPYGLSNDIINALKKQRKVLLLLDVADNASRIYSPSHGAFISSDLGELTDFWGIDFLGGDVVADFDNSITVDETINYKTNPSFTQDLLQFRTSPNDFNRNHRITYKLNNILFSSASVVYPSRFNKKNYVSFFPLIKTSANSALMPAALAKQNAHPREVLANFKPNNQVFVLAAEFLSNSSSHPFDVIAVGDTDFIYDNFWTKEKKFLDSSYNVPFFDSANFILNALDYLTNNDDLISLRGKGLKIRKLDKIDKMRKLNTYKYKLKENDIFDAIDGIKQQLIEITAKRNFEQRETFSADELAIIGKIRQELSDLRQQLSKLRINANNDIDNLVIKVKFFDIYFIALLLLIFIGGYSISQKSFTLSSLKSIFVINRKISLLMFYTVLIIALSLLTIYADNRSTITTYEDKSVFSDFAQKINKIQKIELKGSQNTLSFVHTDNNIWKLEGTDLPVYQERIRKFLSAIHNMTFVEKKSDRAEDMKYFGFVSFQDKNSPMTSVKLYDANGYVLEAFDIGWQNIDIGRGSKGSFIRLDNQFQVWLAEVDFFDLSLNPNAWTYSSLWNLRFGRFLGFNGFTDNKRVMELVKKLLNLYIIGVADNINAKQIGEIKFDIENNNFINLVFYKTADNKFYVQYQFVTKPNGAHLEFFAQFVKNKYLEISEETWESLKNDIITKK